MNAYSAGTHRKSVLDQEVDHRAFHDENIAQKAQLPDAST